MTNTKLNYSYVSIKFSTWTLEQSSPLSYNACSLARLFLLYEGVVNNFWQITAVDVYLKSATVAAEHPERIKPLIREHTNIFIIIESFSGEEVNSTTLFSQKYSN